MDEKSISPLAFPIGDLSVDTTRSPMERMAQFIKKAGDPHLLQVDDYLVQISWTDTKESLQEAVVHLLRENEAW